MDGCPCRRFCGLTASNVEADCFASALVAGKGNRRLRAILGGPKGSSDQVSDVVR